MRKLVIHQKKEKTAKIEPTKDIEKAIAPATHKKILPKKRIIIISIIIFVILALAGFAYYRISSFTVRNQQYTDNGESTNVCTNILNPSCWTEAFRPQLMQTNGTTSVLMIGVDTRSNGSLMNTDSLMILSYNHDTKKTMLTSVPRDLFSFNYNDRINTVYAYTHNRDKNDPYK